MAKRKKTRKQKIVADYRHQIYVLENKNLFASSPIVNTQINTNLPSYSYVLRDISKTAILTSLIIAGQLILFFLLKKHIITLPKISY